MEFKVGQKYKLVSEEHASAVNMKVGDVFEVHAVDTDGAAWSRDYKYKGICITKLEDGINPFTGTSIHEAGFCIGGSGALVSGLFELIQEDNNETIH